MESVKKIIERADGSAVQIVAERGYGAGLACSHNVYVLRRDSADQDWTLTSDRPHPNWRTMSVDEYVRHGRSEMVRSASIAEILTVCAMLRCAAA